MKPLDDCNYCNGTGVVMDYVPYGNGWTQMPTVCECLYRDEECDEVYYAPLPQNRRRRRWLWPPMGERGYVA